MRIKLMQKTTSRRAFSLVEVVITVSLVTFMGISILGALAFGAYQKQSIRERNGALRAAADVMETVRRQHFGQLRPETFENILIDDRGRPGRRGEVRGNMTLRFYNMAGNEVGIPGSPIPQNLTMVRVEVTVFWNPAGKGSRSRQEERLITLLAP